jgi:hypothetical protein
MASAGHNKIKPNFFLSPINKLSRVQIKRNNGVKNQTFRKMIRRINIFQQRRHLRAASSSRENSLVVGLVKVQTVHELWQNVRISFFLPGS